MLIHLRERPAELYAINVTPAAAPIQQKLSSSWMCASRPEKKIQKNPDSTPKIEASTILIAKGLLGGDWKIGAQRAPNTRAKLPVNTINETRVVSAIYTGVAIYTGATATQLMNIVRVNPFKKFIAPSPSGSHTHPSI